MSIYGKFRCEHCASDPGPDCGDWCVCGAEWADDLPPLWTGMDCWPTCRCCGQDAQLVSVLELLAA
jgi:hypothetical protein